MDKEKRGASASEGVSFRIPLDLLTQLYNESGTKQVSLNTLVNQVLKEHAE